MTPIAKVYWSEILKLSKMPVKRFGLEECGLKILIGTRAVFLTNRFDVSSTFSVEASNIFKSNPVGIRNMSRRTEIKVSGMVRVKMKFAAGSNQHGLGCRLYTKILHYSSY